MKEKKEDGSGWLARQLNSSFQSEGSIFFSSSSEWTDRFAIFIFILLLSSSWYSRSVLWRKRTQCPYITTTTPSYVRSFRQPLKEGREKSYIDESPTHAGWLFWMKNWRKNSFQREKKLTMIWHGNQQELCAYSKQIQLQMIQPPTNQTVFSRTTDSTSSYM